MNDSDIVLCINTLDDIKKITSQTKYINLSLFDMNNDIIDYFLINGNKYLYSDSLESHIYASYDYFKKGEAIIQNIIDMMPINLNNIEIAKYIYISLGKILSQDINIILSKNDTVCFNYYTLNNNIWSSLSSHYISNKEIVRLFKYVCIKLDIKCEIICNDGIYSNNIYIDDEEVCVNLFNDLSNIQGAFRTKFFGEYNDDIELDKKIEYIKDRYKDDIVSDFFQYLNVKNTFDIEDLLNKISVLFNIRNIGVCELAIIFKNIFDKYVTNIKIKIRNLFFYNRNNDREHFLIFNYEDNNYYYNYDSNLFECIKNDVLLNNLDNGSMSYYRNEDGDMVC